ncbi:P22 phage major capsid protein family protein [Curtobacterium sp. MCBD17_035]|nr:P22 phage major capsid protein family protein [Curtobacterium sp. MCBD17_035]WIB66227.1 P22 phage major capsid protein family protein [Curtobacterium sp. MCBD17_035]
MPNQLLTPDNIAGTAAALVGKGLGLAALLHRDLEADFSAGSGDTVKVRVPGAIAVQTKGIYDTTTPLVRGSISEQSIDVKLTTHAYDSVVLSEGDMDLEIGDFAKQILLPQADAIVNYVERTVAATLKATPETELSYDPAAPARVFTQIRRQLRDNGVPTTATLIAAVGSGVMADLIDGPIGSSGTTFDADGKVRGFQIVESTRLAANEIVAFVPEAFALVVRAPASPDGAPYSASVKSEGFALRHIRSYDPSLAVDTSLLSAFVGVQAMPLAIDNEDGTVTLKPNAGAVRVLTASA